MKGLETYIQYNTLDVDSNDKELINRIFNKVITCLRLVDIELYPSERKGFHFKLYCKVRCDNCRLVFDDDVRFSYDQYREQKSRDVLTTTTEQITLRLKKNET